MKKGLKKLGIGLGIVALIVIVIGLLFPGLLWKRPLGVKYSNKELYSANEKLDNIQKEINNKENCLIEEEFSSSELTAIANENDLSFYSIKDVEIRISNDKIIEMSAKVDLKLLLDEIAIGYTKEQLEEEIPALGFLPNTLNMYIKFSGDVLNNDLSLDISDIQIQGVNLPYKYYSRDVFLSKIKNDWLNKLKIKNDISFNYIKIEEELVKVQIELNNCTK